MVGSLLLFVVAEPAMSLIGYSHWMQGAQWQLVGAHLATGNNARLFLDLKDEQSSRLGRRHIISSAGNDVSVAASFSDGTPACCMQLRRHDGLGYKRWIWPHFGALN